MALPLPKVVPDTGPGGGLVTAMGGINALAHNMLKRKYYAPDMESQINNRNALTEGQKIDNQYAPERLNLANVFAQLRNQYYGPNIQSEINSRNELTKGQKFKNDNPLMGMPGSAGQVGSLVWLNKLKKENPEAYADMMERGIYPDDNQSQPQPQPQPNGNELGSFVPSINQNENNQQPQPQPQAVQQPANNINDPAMLLHQMLTRNKKISPSTQKAIDIADLQAGFMPGTNKTQRIDQQTAKQIIDGLQKVDTTKHTQLYNAKQELEEAKKMYGPDSQEVKDAESYVHRIAVGANQLSEKNAEGYAWTKAPINLKNSMLAQAAGMGIDPSAAEKSFTEGKTIADLAKEHGFDPKHLPQPDYLPTNGNITKLKERQAALAELKSLKDFTTKNLKPYSETFLGYSPKQIVDSALGRNKNQLTKFLAARALSQEENLVRLTVANARGTIPAIKSLSEKAMADIKDFRSLVSKDVFEGARNLIDSELEKALKAASKSYTPKATGSNSNKIKPVHEMTLEEIKAELGE